MLFAALWRCVHYAVCCAVAVRRLLSQGVQEGPCDAGAGACRDGVSARELVLRRHGASIQGPAIRVQGPHQGQLLPLGTSIANQHGADIV